MFCKSFDNVLSHVSHVFPNSDGVAVIWVKVHIFWESHKILQNLHPNFDWHYIQDKGKVKISQNFVAFSEYMNYLQYH